MRFPCPGARMPPAKRTNGVDNKFSGKCAVCGRVFALYMDGRVFAHKEPLKAAATKSEAKQ